MNHYSLDEETALEMIKSIYRNLKDKNEIDNYASYSFISSWANNYNSWKNANLKNKLIIKYEDLEINVKKTFEKIVTFSNKLMNNKKEIDKEKLNKSARNTNFDILRKMEKKKGFDEAILSLDGTKKAFFNLGKQNNYKKLLSLKTTQDIEKVFNKEMKELGYL